MERFEGRNGVRSWRAPFRLDRKRSRSRCVSLDFCSVRNAQGALAHETLSNHFFRFGPNPTTRAQALNQLAIFCQQEADPVLGKPRFGQKLLNFFDDWLCHAVNYTRFSVQVNARYYVQAPSADAC